MITVFLYLSLSILLASTSSVSCMEVTPPEERYLERDDFDEGLSSVEMVERLVQSQPDAIHSPFSLEKYLIHIAAAQRNLPVLKWLIANGAIINQRTRCPHGVMGTEALAYGWEAIHFAAQTGDGEIIQWLIDNGASISATTDSGMQPIHIAAAFGHVEALNILVRNGAKMHALDLERRRPVNYADNSHRIPALEWFVRHGACIYNIESKLENSPLLSMIQEGLSVTSEEPDLFGILSNIVNISPSAFITFLVQLSSVYDESRFAPILRKVPAILTNWFLNERINPSPIPTPPHEYQDLCILSMAAFILSPPEDSTTLLPIERDPVSFITALVQNPHPNAMLTFLKTTLLGEPDLIVEISAPLFDLLIRYASPHEKIWLCRIRYKISEEAMRSVFLPCQEPPTITPHASDEEGTSEHALRSISDSEAELLLFRENRTPTELSPLQAIEPLNLLSVEDPLSANPALTLPETSPREANSTIGSLYEPPSLRDWPNPCTPRLAVATLAIIAAAFITQWSFAYTI